MLKNTLIMNFNLSRSAMEIRMCTAYACTVYWSVRMVISSLMCSPVCTVSVLDMKTVKETPV